MASGASGLATAARVPLSLLEPQAYAQRPHLTRGTCVLRQRVRPRVRSRACAACTAGMARLASSLWRISYAIVLLVVAFIAFELWRPSVLLVGNVTIDEFPSRGKAKRLPGGAPPIPCQLDTTQLDPRVRARGNARINMAGAVVFCSPAFRCLACPSGHSTPRTCGHVLALPMHAVEPDTCSLGVTLQAALVERCAHRVRASRDPRRVRSSAAAQSYARWTCDASQVALLTRGRPAPASRPARTPRKRRSSAAVPPDPHRTTNYATHVGCRPCVSLGRGVAPTSAPAQKLHSCPL